MFRNPFQREVPRGLSWVAILLIAVAIVVFGQLIISMAIGIAFRLVHLVIDVAVLGAIVFGLFYGIRFVSRKTEP